MSLPEISIITPVYNMLPFLKRCIYSVRDQNVKYEHIIVDGLSTDGTKEWLKNSDKLTWLSEKDSGMYNALNKGVNLASGEIIGHLNADEQYLPGTLEAVVKYFKENPDVDFITGDYLVIDRKGDLIAYRKSFPLMWPFFFSNYLYAFTCTLFYRQKVVSDLRYNEEFSAISDMAFVYEMIKRGYKGAYIKRFQAAFTNTGNNLSLMPEVANEKEKYEDKNLPFWFSYFRVFFRLFFYVVRFFYGSYYHKGGIRYEVFDESNLNERKIFFVKKPKWRMPANLV